MYGLVARLFKKQQYTLSAYPCERVTSKLKADDIAKPKLLE